MAHQQLKGRIQYLFCIVCLLRKIQHKIAHWPSSKLAIETICYKRSLRMSNVFWSGSVMLKTSDMDFNSRSLVFFHYMILNFSISAKKSTIIYYRMLICQYLFKIGDFLRFFPLIITPWTYTFQHKHKAFFIMIIFKSN